MRVIYIKSFCLPLLLTNTGQNIWLVGKEEIHCYFGLLPAAQALKSVHSFKPYFGEGWAESWTFKNILKQKKDLGFEELDIGKLRNAGLNTACLTLSCGLDGTHQVIRQVELLCLHCILHPFCETLPGIVYFSQGALCVACSAVV